MPPDTTMRTFIEAVRSGRTKTTEALDELIKTRGSALQSNFDKPGDLDGPGFLRWAESELKSLGLSQTEIYHLADWPDAEKEKVRDWLITAITSHPRRNVLFFWELYDGNASKSEVANLTGAGNIFITFRSPINNLRVKGMPAGGPDDVRVLVP